MGTGGGERELNFKKPKWKATFPIVQRREREGSFLGVGGTSGGRALCCREEMGEFSSPPRGWGDGICAGCCRGWEGFSACGRGGGAGFPAPGVLPAGWCSRRQRRYHCRPDDAPSDNGGTNRMRKGEGKWTVGSGGNRPVRPVRWSNRWFKWFNSGPIASRCNWPDRTGTVTGRFGPVLKTMAQSKKRQ